jgi:hypothetical protein
MFWGIHQKVWILVCRKKEKKRSAFRDD